MPAIRIFAALLCCLSIATLGAAAEDAAKDTTGAIKPYTLDKCVVNGDDLDSDATVIVYHGQEVKLCCKKCIKKFNADPEKWLAEIQQEIKDKDARK